MAVAVVLPEPCRPTSMMTLGMRPDSTSCDAGAAEKLGHLLDDDLDDHLAGGERLHDIGADSALAHLGDELLDDLVVHVGFEQRHADLPHRGIDIGLGQLALAGQAREDRLETVGEVLKHRYDSLRSGHAEVTRSTESHGSQHRRAPSNRLADEPHSRDGCVDRDDAAHHAGERHGSHVAAVLRVPAIVTHDVERAFGDLVLPNGVAAVRIDDLSALQARRRR